MAANTAARFSLNGNNASDGGTTMAPIFTTAAADYTGATATHNKKVFQADATNGSRLAGIHFEAIGTNTASVARIFSNNGSANTTASNNSFLGQISLPATTATNVASTPSVDFIFTGGYIDLEAGFAIYAGIATTVAAGWFATPILGGDF